jgi:hypothetical protein
MVFGNEQVQTLQGWKWLFLHHLVMKFMEVISFPLQVVCFFPVYMGEAILKHI